MDKLSDKPLFCMLLNPCLTFLCCKLLGLSWNEEVELTSFCQCCAYEWCFLLFRCLCEKRWEMYQSCRKKGRKGEFQEEWRSNEALRNQDEQCCSSQEMHSCAAGCTIMLQSQKPHTVSCMIVHWASACLPWDARLPVHRRTTVRPGGFCDLIIFSEQMRGVRFYFFKEHLSA